MSAHPARRRRGCLARHHRHPALGHRHDDGLTHPVHGELACRPRAPAYRRRARRTDARSPSPRGREPGPLQRHAALVPAQVDLQPRLRIDLQRAAIRQRHAAAFRVAGFDDLAARKNQHRNGKRTDSGCEARADVPPGDPPAPLPGRCGMRVRPMTREPETTAHCAPVFPGARAVLPSRRDSRALRAPARGAASRPRAAKTRAASRRIVRAGRAADHWTGAVPTTQPLRRPPGRDVHSRSWTGFATGRCRARFAASRSSSSDRASLPARWFPVRAAIWVRLIPSPNCSASTARWRAVSVDSARSTSARASARLASCSGESLREQVCEPS